MAIPFRSLCGRCYASHVTQAASFHSQQADEMAVTTLIASPSLAVAFPTLLSKRLGASGARIHLLGHSDFLPSLGTQLP